MPLGIAGDVPAFGADSLAREGAVPSPCPEGVGKRHGSGPGVEAAVDFAVDGAIVIAAPSRAAQCIVIERLRHPPLGADAHSAVDVTVARVDQCASRNGADRRCSCNHCSRIIAACQLHYEGKEKQQIQLVTEGKASGHHEEYKYRIP